MTDKSFPQPDSHPELMFPGSDGARPEVFATMRDTVLYCYDEKGEQAPHELDFALKDLVTHDDLMESFARAATSPANLGNIWEQNLYRTFKKDNDTNLLGDDESFHIAQNKHEKLLAATTLCVARPNGTPDPDLTNIHFIHNAESGRTVIVGEQLPPTLREAFAKANICYVGRGDSDARQKLLKGIEAVIGPDDATYLYNRVYDAVRYRLDIKEDVALEDTPDGLLRYPAFTLEDLLLRNDLDMLYFKYPVQTEKQPPSVGLYRIARALELPEPEHLLKALDAQPGLVNKKTGPQQSTPLMLAAEAGDLDGVMMLVKRKAALDAQDASGKTALAQAVEFGHFRVALYLKEQGARLDIPDAAGKTVESDFAKVTQLGVLKPLRLKIPRPGVGS